MINPNTAQVYSLIKEGDQPLKAVRKALGMKQAELAVKLDVAVSTLSRWENGHAPVMLTVPQILIFEDLLRQVGLTFQALAAEEEET
jgi:transcriptional regulator with XRE-family HTH domain